jgi:hypothetical protein
MRALRTWTNDCYRLLLLLRSDQPLDGVGHDLATRLLEPTEHASPGTAELRARLLDGAGRLTEAERESLAVGLLMARNKVTHIYELVKAAGSGRQVEFDRPGRVWRRREPIAQKHAYEAAVDPLSGRIVRGVEHAPLLYAGDPRTDLPAELEVRVRDVLRGRDPTVVSGWLAASGQ